MKIKIQAILKVLAKLRRVAILALVAGITVYTLFQMTKVLSLRPDPDYLAKEKDKQAKGAVKFDQKVIDQIKALLQVGGQTKPGENVGKADPFS